MTRSEMGWLVREAVQQLKSKGNIDVAEVLATSRARLEYVSSKGEGDERVSVIQIALGLSPDLKPKLAEAEECLVEIFGNLVRDRFTDEYGRRCHAHLERLWIVTTEEVDLDEMGWLLSEAVQQLRSEGNTNAAEVLATSEAMLKRVDSWWDGHDGYIYALHITLAVSPQLAPRLAEAEKCLVRIFGNLVRHFPLVGERYQGVLEGLSIVTSESEVNEEKTLLLADGIYCWTGSKPGWTTLPLRARAGQLRLTDRRLCFHSRSVSRGSLSVPLSDLVRYEFVVRRFSNYLSIRFSNDEGKPESYAFMNRMYLPHGRAWQEQIEQAR